MTSSEQAREEIAQVLDAVFGVEFSRPYEEVLRDGVDAILARWPVLAGVTDEMVEAGARALWDARRSPTDHTWDDIAEGGLNRPYPTYPHIVDDIRREARAVLSAVLGPRPGDGSTT